MIHQWNQQVQGEKNNLNHPKLNLQIEMSRTSYKINHISSLSAHNKDLHLHTVFLVNFACVLYTGCWQTHIIKNKSKTKQKHPPPNIDILKIHTELNYFIWQALLYGFMKKEFDVCSIIHHLITIIFRQEK